MIMTIFGAFAGAVGSAAPSVSVQKRNRKERIGVITRF
jgi:hypothetical protein